MVMFLMIVSYSVFGASAFQRITCPTHKDGNTLDLLTNPLQWWSINFKWRCVSSSNDEHVYWFFNALVHQKIHHCQEYRVWTRHCLGLKLKILFFVVVIMHLLYCKRVNNLRTKNSRCCCNETPSTTERTQNYFYQYFIQEIRKDIIIGYFA